MYIYARSFTIASSRRRSYNKRAAEGICLCRCVYYQDDGGGGTFDPITSRNTNVLPEFGAYGNRGYISKATTQAIYISILYYKDFEQFLIKGGNELLIVIYLRVPLYAIVKLLSFLLNIIMYT